MPGMGYVLSPMGLPPSSDVVRGAPRAEPCQGGPGARVRVTQAFRVTHRGGRRGMLRGLRSKEGCIGSGSLTQPRCPRTGTRRSRTSEAVSQPVAHTSENPSLVWPWPCQDRALASPQGCSHAGKGTTLSAFSCKFLSVGQAWRSPFVGSSPSVGPSKDPSPFLVIKPNFASLLSG